MVSRDHVNGAIHQRVPERLVVASLADGWVDPHDAAKLEHVLGVEQQILRTGLGRHINPTAFGLAQQIQRIGRAVVSNMNARAGPFGKGEHPANGLNFSHSRPRGQMRQCVNATSQLHVLLASAQDGRVFCVHHGTNTQRGKFFKALQQSTIGRCRQITKGVTDKCFKTRHTRVQQRLKVVHCVVA